MPTATTFTSRCRSRPCGPRESSSITAAAEPLGADQGGPIRFLIRDPAACHTHELDDCANVKFLSRIELTERRGRDTRPQTDEEHAKLHEGAEPGQPSG